MNKGYKAMLRDRLLPSWNLALLWCKVKNRWIERAYAENIANTPKPLRSDLCKFITGRKKNYGVTCSFWTTIDPDGFLFGEDREEYNMWKNVQKWVDWFSQNQIFIYNTLQDIEKTQYIFDNILDTLCKKYPHIDRKLLTFMIKNKHIYYDTK